MKVVRVYNLCIILNWHIGFTECNLFYYTFLAGDADHIKVDDDFIEAYKIENSKLVKENNTLNLQLLKNKDELDATNKS